MYFRNDSFDIEGLKKQLRRQAIKERDGISVPDRIFYSRMIFERIRKELFYQRATNILLYSSFGSEVRTDEFLTQCIQDGKKVYYPKTTMDDYSMEFYEIYSIKDLNEGNYGIREPYGLTKAYSNKMITGVSDTLMIVPGVAFDTMGHRVGYGKGYYDRYLSRFPDIFKCGVAFEIQIKPSVPFDDTDELLDALVTEGNLWIKQGIGGVRWS